MGLFTFLNTLKFNMAPLYNKANFLMQLGVKERKIRLLSVVQRVRTIKRVIKPIQAAIARAKVHRVKETMSGSKQVRTKVTIRVTNEFEKTIEFRQGLVLPEVAPEIDRTKNQ